MLLSRIWKRSYVQENQGEKTARYVLLFFLKTHTHTPINEDVFGQKLSYEERMARRLLGPDNANYVFDQDSLSDSQLDQVPSQTVATDLNNTTMS